MRVIYKQVGTENFYFVKKIIYYVILFIMMTNVNELEVLNNFFHHSHVKVNKKHNIIILKKLLQYDL